VLIIPAIDLRAGNAVRLAQGDFHRETIYDTDPISVAGGFIDAGAQWLHVVDLDGARSGEPHHWSVLENIVRLGVPIQFGGGIRSLETAHRALELGVARIVVGTRLVTDPWFAARLFADFGERVAAGIDAREGHAAASGWEQNSELRAEEVATKSAQDGCRRIILTDIQRDGMQSGPNTELFMAVKRASALPVIHSGGIGSVADLRVLAGLGADAPEGVIIGRALYEGTLVLEEALLAAAPI
jgi:phosphoribosylformimino-5-aminoimidazole carboxamide ribotide isomerase